jgi:large subunit ribosomal protein L30
MTDKLAAVRIRSDRGAKQPVKDTLKLLNLTKKHRCVVLDKTPQNRGMLRKVEDFIAFGEITADTEDDLGDERADTAGKDNVYRLSSPDGGYEPAGVKVNYEAGGANGYRGDNMNDLLQRML